MNIEQFGVLRCMKFYLWNTTAANVYDQYAVALKKRLPGQISLSVVGHLPKELSCFVHYILYHGAKASARVMQGGNSWGNCGPPTFGQQQVFTHH